MLMESSPFGVQMAPRRGAKFAFLPNVVADPGYPVSPGNNKPAGACGYTLLRTPASKPARSKWLTQSYVFLIGRNGSQRTPAFSEIFERTFQLSCAYAP